MPFKRARGSYYAYARKRYAASRPYSRTGYRRKGKGGAKRGNVWTLSGAWIKKGGGQMTMGKKPQYRPWKMPDAAYVPYHAMFNRYKPAKPDDPFPRGRPKPNVGQPQKPGTGRRERERKERVMAGKPQRSGWWLRDWFQTLGKTQQANVLRDLPYADYLNVMESMYPGPNYNTVDSGWGGVREPGAL